MTRLERIAATIRARPRDYAANNALTAGLSHDELIEVWRLIDAQAAAVQAAEAAQEVAERRAAYRRAPRRPRPALRGDGRLLAVVLFGIAALGVTQSVSWRALILIVVVVLVWNVWLRLCRVVLGGRR